MILRVIGYGDPLLRKQSEDIEKDYPNLDKLIADMFETMYESHGVGLAAPQIGLNINMFVIDTTPIEDNKDGIKRAFINPIILKEDGEPWAFEEGCLSLPKIREDVIRDERIVLSYFDENFVEHEEVFDDINARVIQHEYDHLEGILFIDHLSGVKKRLLKKRLNEIVNGSVEADYPMKYYKQIVKK
ncbi:MAG: peptide deformylase [Bacteroidetes bacterium]|jgi:peptide deformylase|nr:peptide deformylase [Bacteroidota bacterium]MBT5531200.1 peptide deformylase [Cytophagia bacterium]MBT3423251.1 peptide deformylase [Bacteroidota bacterium]MBT3801411.1 peptide deformylase [Bacteroidota bacterium]MBT3934258.1 peptide deformylase [Bacteroidota bacterium]